jgi:hypothetical protein
MNALLMHDALMQLRCPAGETLPTHTQAFGESPTHEDISLASMVPNSGIILIGEGAPEVDESLEKRQQLQLPNGRKIRVSAPALRDGNVLCSVL